MAPSARHPIRSPAALNITRGREQGPIFDPWQANTTAANQATLTLAVVVVRGHIDTAP